MSYRRSQERNRRLRRLSEATAKSHHRGAYYDVDRNRYVRFYASKSGHARWLRRVANRAVRRSLICSHGGQYRTEFDYWWTLT